MLVFELHHCSAQEPVKPRSDDQIQPFKGDYKVKKLRSCLRELVVVFGQCPKLSVNIYKLGINIAKDRLKRLRKQINRLHCIW